MGEVLPPKRQTVVERLRRRLDLYRRHQGSCLPRYDQTANGLYDSQRQDTLLLKQRFLEAKAKKTRRNDNHGRHAPRDNANSEAIAQRNALVAQSKLKRPAGSPLLDCAIDGLVDSHPKKVPRSGSTPDHHCGSNTTQQQAQQQQTGIPSFSVQIVQQFTSSNTSQAPHSQTIQTNVTVQALSGGSIKTSNSPLTSNSVSTTSSPAHAGNEAGNRINCSGVGTPIANGGPSTSISVGTSIECKQEPDTNFAQCSVNSSHPLHELSNELSNANNNVNTTTSSSTAATAGDRFSDSLANLGFPEDSNDDVIHPDILKDIIDDVFTNPSDLMNGFSFVDNVSMKDSNSNGASNCQNIVDEKDSMRTMMNMGKTIPNNSNPQNHFQNSGNNPGVSQFSVSQSQQSVFDFQTGNMNSSTSPLSVPNNINTSQQGFSQNRMGSYAATSPNLAAMNNNGLGLDFKLTEPSPAAQTLKQMAEQHQNMQQKQQQMGLTMTSSHPRSPFGSDSFPDPLSNIRSNFLNGSQTAMNPLQKSPNNLFQTIGYNQQQGFPPTSVSNVKQEVGTPATSMYTGMNPSSISQHLSDMEMHKRRQQVLQMQQQQMASVQRPAFSHSPDQKPPLGLSGTTAYGGTRPLTHYNDPSGPPSHGSASNSPIPHHPGQFMRGVTTPGVTPPPNFGSSPSPSGSSLHLSQSQQLQISHNNQQLQVSQSQQQLLVSQDLKPTISTQHHQQQQQQQVQATSFYPGHTSVHMSQSQSVSFQFGGTPASRGTPNAAQRPQNNVPRGGTTTAQQRQMQYMGRPPPEYQSSLEPNSNANNVVNQMASGLTQQQQPTQQQMNPTVISQRIRPVDNRKGVPMVPGYPGTIPLLSQQEHGVSVPSSHSLMMPNTTLTSTYTSGRGRAAPKQVNSRTNVTSNKQSYLRHQRPPNVNVGPEGLNISQRPPSMTSDWRHVFMQQQQQQQQQHQQLNSNLQIRIPYSRGIPTNYGQVVGNNTGNSFVGLQLEPSSNSGSSGMLSRDVMSNSMRQISDQTLTIQGGLQSSNSATTNHLLIQQQQAMLQGGNGSDVGLSAAQLQMAASGTLPMTPPLRDSANQQVFANSPQSSSRLDDSSQNIVPDGSQFSLDFLDNIDCSTSDLLNFDVMQGGSSGFQLLDDMGMLGK